MSDQQQPVTAAPAQDDNKLIAERRAKLAAIREKKGVAFPNDYRREHTSGPLHAQYDAVEKEPLEAQAVAVSVAGRMMLKRVMGKASFATLQDVSGQIQLYVSRDSVGEDVYAGFKTWDLAISSARVAR